MVIIVTAYSPKIQESVLSLQNPKHTFSGVFIEDIKSYV